MEEEKWVSEMLCKAGFKSIVKQRIYGSTGTIINWRGKNLKKILKLDDMNEVRFARDHVISAESLSDIKWLKQKGIQLTPGTHHVFRNQNSILYTKLSNIDNPVKLANYIYDSNGTAREYIDYIKTVNQLGYQINKKVLYPVDLMNAHDDVMDKLKTKFNKNKTKFFQKTENAIITKEYEEDYIIRAAKNPSELISESKKLNHCVRRYVDDVARGYCAIAFVRKKEKPEESFFTVEISPERNIEQIKGFCNCLPPPEVEAAVYKWAASMA